MIMNIKQRKIKIEPRIKLNYNIYKAVTIFLSFLQQHFVIVQKYSLVVKYFIQC